MLQGLDLGSSVRSRELDSMTLMGPFSPKIHCGQGMAASKGLALTTRAPAELRHLVLLSTIKSGPE